CVDFLKGRLIWPLVRTIFPVSQGIVVRKYAALRGVSSTRVFLGIPDYPKRQEPSQLFLTHKG
ncbi:MAG: hypothetical protein KBG84_07145, partial [Planctomycetes bacterium]|nr:hypothetical protein [Planctomycetota bacterium]